MVDETKKQFQIVKYLIVALALSANSVAQNYHDWSVAKGVGSVPGSDDTDRDGMSNFLEYALGMDPTQPEVLQQTAFPASLLFSKGQDAVASGNVIWEIQMSGTLDTADWQVVTPTVENDTSISHTLNYHQAGRRFFRLAVRRTPHPAAIDYAGRTGLSGTPLAEVSALLHDLNDGGITPDFLLLTGDRYMARNGSNVEAVIGGTGTLVGTVDSDAGSMVFNGSAAWIEFDNPARSPVLADYSLFAVASAASTTAQSLVASSFGGSSARGARLMFNASDSWGAGAGRIWADANNGAATSTTGWNTATRIHSGGQLLPISLGYSASAMVPRGDLPPPTPAPRLTVSAGLTRSSAAFSPLSTTLWNDSSKFRIGANLTGGAFHNGRISVVMVTRSPVYSEPTYQLLASSPVRAGIVPGYVEGVVAIFDGDSVTEGAGSPGGASGTWSWPAQLFGNSVGQHAGGQWSGRFSGRNVAVGGRAIASSEASWEHTTRHILARPEWGTRYHFTMISHNQITAHALPPMQDPSSLKSLKTLWRKSAALGAVPVCVGLVSGQSIDTTRIADYDLGYAAVEEMAALENVQFVDTAAISQLRRGVFPNGADYFYADGIHPTEKGYRLIAQEVAATVPLPGSTAPRSLERPAISGVPVVAVQLVVSHGTWEHAPVNLSFQWMRDGMDIDGAIAESYSPSPSDVGARLSCRVTAQNSMGKAERTSTHTTPVLANQ